MDNDPGKPALEDNGESSSPKEMSVGSAIGNLILAIPAIAVAVLLWPISLLLLKDGAGPIGGAEKLTVLVFLAPIGFAILPAVVKLFDNGKAAMAIWLIALAPIVGGLNIALAILILVYIGQHGDSFTQPVQWLVILVWSLPLISHVQRPKAKRSN